MYETWGLLYEKVALLYEITFEGLFQTFKIGIFSPFWSGIFLIFDI